jgi:DNA-binding MarR family transcriptional regulator
MNEDTLLQYLRRHGPLTKFEIMGKFELSFSQADSMLRRLRQKGYVELIHPQGSRRSRSEYKWQVTTIVQYSFPWF